MTEPQNQSLEERIRSSSVLLPLALAVLIVNGLVGLRFATQSLFEPWLYRADFVQEYLLGKALLAGADPYQPLPQLAAAFLPESLATQKFQHPTPHLPPVALFFAPFALVSFQTATILWFAIKIILLVFITRLLVRYAAPNRTVLTDLVVLSLVLNSSAMRLELLHGQLNIALLALLVGSWRALANRRELTGGLLLGLTISLRMLGWPIVFYLIARRRVRATAAAISVPLILNAATAAIVGIRPLLFYYRTVGLEVAKIYLQWESNQSLWSIAGKVFKGTVRVFGSTIASPPLFLNAALAAPVAVIIVLATVIIALYLALRMKSFDRSFGLLICISILVNPICWEHYLISLGLPVAVVFRGLARKPDQPFVPTLLFIIVVLFAGGTRYLRTIVIGDAASYSFLQSLVTLLPLAITLFTIAALVLLDRNEPAI